MRAARPPRAAVPVTSRSEPSRKRAETAAWRGIPCPPGSNSRAMLGTEMTPRTLVPEEEPLVGGGPVTSSQRPLGDQTRSWKRLSPVKSACLRPSARSQTVEESAVES